MTLIAPQQSRREEFLPFAPPLIGEEEIAEVVDTLRSGWITTGPKTVRFTHEFAEYVCASAAAPCNSCTAALHLALASAGIGPGDEVITTPLTFAATANVIEHVGAHPVFADVEPDTLNIDASRVAAAITPRTRAVIAVHYAGHPAEMDHLQELASAARLLLVEDAAHALPAAYRGRRVGSGANPTAFSFYATKNMTTGEGGMLTGTPDLVARARVFSLHGMSADAWKRYSKSGTWQYDVVSPGFKYNMMDLQAAIGLQQLKKLPAFHRRRCAVAEAYTRAFAECDALEPPTRRPYVDHAWHLYVLRLRLDALRIGRDAFIDELLQRNIGVSVHFIPVHLHPYYRDRYALAPERFPIALANYERMISLPLHPGLSPRDVDDVIEAVLDVARIYRR